MQDFEIGARRARVHVRADAAQYVVTRAWFGLIRRAQCDSWYTNPSHHPQQLHSVRVRCLRLYPGRNLCQMGGQRSLWGQRTCTVALLRRSSPELHGLVEVPCTLVCRHQHHARLQTALQGG